MNPPSGKIRVKMIARGGSAAGWRSHLSRSDDIWGDCLFLFDAEAGDYDFLVVIDDISRKLSSPAEKLACANEHTLLVTTEPPTITRYGDSFCRQFHSVLTTHPADSIPHPNRIYSQTGNLWFNGHTASELQSLSFTDKPNPISTVCSSKQQKHTLHQERLSFTEWLCAKLPQIQRFGHGYKQLPHKYSALDTFRFHLAIENWVGPHHWTEKFSDPILSECLPIYYGCPNLADYFPAEAYVPIDIQQPGAALEQMEALIHNPNLYQQRRPAILEAKQLILNNYNLLKIISDHVSRTFNPHAKPSGRPLYGRKQMRLRSPHDLVRHSRWLLTR